MPPPSAHLIAAAVLAGAALAGCASPEAAQGAGDCPEAPVEIVVTVGQWSDLATTLAGACGHVTTIVSGSAGDPHDFEPTTSDAARFTHADLVVANGLGYDEWAGHVVDTLSPRPPVVDAGEAAGLGDGEDPHVWYGPQHVARVADAVTAALATQMPAAAAYLAERRAVWTEQTRALDEAVVSLHASAAGRTFAATEPVFDHMAAAVGLVDRTPPGFAAAAANETDPAPGDVYALDQELRSRAVDVLVFNPQTDSALDDQVRRSAAAASVPVVEVTETIPAGVDGFVAWQVGQLDVLARALGVR